MSAPNTDPEKNVPRNRGSLSALMGLAAVLVVLLIGWMMWTGATAPVEPLREGPAVLKNETN